MLFHCKKERDMTFISYCIGNGKSCWIGDGFCDDINNNLACNYDGGDCCGNKIKKHFCVQCECTCKFGNILV